MVGAGLNRLGGILLLLGRNHDVICLAFSSQGRLSFFTCQETASGLCLERFILSSMKHNTLFF